MTFESIDANLDAWAREHQLAVQREYRGEEVRSFEIVDAQGCRYQIWIDPPLPGSPIGVHVWDFGNRRLDATSERQELTSALTAALDKVRQWIGEAATSG